MFGCKKTRERGPKKRNARSHSGSGEKRQKKKKKEAKRWGVGAKKERVKNGTTQRGSGARYLTNQRDGNEVKPEGQKRAGPKGLSYEKPKKER